MKRILASLIDSDGLAAMLSALREIARERGGNVSRPKSSYWNAIEASIAQLQNTEDHFSKPHNQK